MEMIIIIIIIKILIIIIKPATPFQEHWHGLINVWHLAKSLRKLSNNDRLLSNVGSIFLSLNLDYQKIDERAYCMSPTFFFLIFFYFSKPCCYLLELHHFIFKSRNTSATTGPSWPQIVNNTVVPQNLLFTCHDSFFFFFWFGCGIWLQPSILQL